VCWVFATLNFSTSMLWASFELVTNRWLSLIQHWFIVNSPLIHRWTIVKPSLIHLRSIVEPSLILSWFIHDSSLIHRWCIVDLFVSITEFASLAQDMCAVMMTEQFTKILIITYTQAVKGYQIISLHSFLQCLQCKLIAVIIWCCEHMIAASSYNLSISVLWSLHCVGSTCDSNTQGPPR